MKKQIRLVALDLDGTLLNTEKKITPRTRAALDQIRARGVMMVPVTGRPGKGLPQAVLDLPGLQYAVASNGATIRNVATGEILLEKHLAAADCLAVLEKSASFSMIREAFREGIGYLSQEDYDILCARYESSAMLDYLRETRRVLPGTVAEFLEADGGPVEELFFLTDSPQTKADLQRTLSDLPSIGFADPFPNDLEVIAGDIDKGEAFLYLLSLLGVDPDETLAMGDGGSDLPLLRAAGIGVAMGNAVDHVKAEADFVTTTCDEDGVAAALERFVLRNTLD